MAESFAKQMIDQLEAALRTQPGGVVSVAVDGQSVRYARDQLIKELDYWRRKLAREEGRRPISGQINLEGSW